MRPITTKKENIYIPYHSIVAGNVPAAGSMVPGEWALNVPDKLLFIGDAGGNPTTKIDLNQELPNYAGADKDKMLVVNAAGDDLEWIEQTLPGMEYAGDVVITNDPATLPAVHKLTIYRVKVTSTAIAAFDGLGSRHFKAGDFLIRTIDNQWVSVNDLVGLREKVDKLLPTNLLVNDAPITLPGGGVLANDGHGALTWINPFPDNAMGSLQNDGAGTLTWKDVNDWSMAEWSADRVYKKNAIVNFNGEMWQYASPANSVKGESPTTAPTKWKQLVFGNKRYVSSTAPTIGLDEGDEWFDDSADGGSTYTAIKQGADYIWVDSDGRGDGLGLDANGLKKWRASEIYLKKDLVAFDGSIFTVLADTVAGESPGTAAAKFKVFAGGGAATSGGGNLKVADFTVSGVAAAIDTLYLVEKDGQADASYTGISHAMLYVGDMIEYIAGKWQVTTSSKDEVIYNLAVTPPAELGKAGDLAIKRGSGAAGVVYIVPKGKVVHNGKMMGGVLIPDFWAAAIVAAKGIVTYRGVTYDAGIPTAEPTMKGYGGYTVNAGEEITGSKSVWLFKGPDAAAFIAKLPTPFEAPNTPLAGYKLSAGGSSTDHELFLKNSSNAWHRIFKVDDASGLTTMDNLEVGSLLSKMLGGLKPADGLLSRRNGKFVYGQDMLISKDTDNSHIYMDEPIPATFNTTGIRVPANNNLADPAFKDASKVLLTTVAPTIRVDAFTHQIHILDIHADFAHTGLELSVHERECVAYMNLTALKITYLGAIPYQQYPFIISQDTVTLIESLSTPGLKLLGAILKTGRWIFNAPLNVGTEHVDSTGGKTYPLLGVLGNNIRGLTNNIIPTGSVIDEGAFRAPDAGAAGKTEHDKFVEASTIKLGGSAGSTVQGYGAVAVGRFAGNATQGASAVAVGSSAGQTTQGDKSVSIGLDAGQTTQGTYSVALGAEAGVTTQGAYSVAVGGLAGKTTQGTNAVAVGKTAGGVNQGDFTVALGAQAAYKNQGDNAVAIGMDAASTNQGDSAIAIGKKSGLGSQGASAVAIGDNSGGNSQGDTAVSIGYEAGFDNQGDNAIAIGKQSGVYNQPAESIALGNAANPQGVGGINIKTTAALMEYDPRSKVFRFNNPTHDSIFSIETKVFADNAAAKAGGLVATNIYRKADGTLMIVH